MTTRHAHQLNGNGQKLYIGGFIASVILLFAIFSIVKGHLLSTQGLYIAVSIFALIEALILVFCFQLLNTSHEDRDWNTLAFIFTLMVMLVVVGGSLWIMYSLNYNMGS